MPAGAGSCYKIFFSKAPGGRGVQLSGKCSTKSQSSLVRQEKSQGEIQEICMCVRKRKRSAKTTKFSNYEEK